VIARSCTRAEGIAEALTDQFPDPLLCVPGLFFLSAFSSVVSPTPPASATPEVEPNDTLANAQASSIANGFGWQTFEGSFVENDTDYYAFSVPAGMTVDVLAVTHGVLNDFATCPTDTILYLEDASGSVIDLGDDTGFGLCSQVTRTLTAGTYHVRVVEFSGSAAPSYLLSVVLR
jgi:hypothetical protein